MYHKNVGGEDWRLLSFFFLRGENFFFMGRFTIFFWFFDERFELQNIDEVWLTSFTISMIKSMTYITDNNVPFFLLKDHVKVLYKKVYMLVENFDFLKIIIRRNFLLRSSFWLERRWVESNSFRSGTCGIKVFFA